MEACERRRLSTPQGLKGKKRTQSRLIEFYIIYIFLLKLVFSFLPCHKFTPWKDVRCSHTFQEHMSQHVQLVMKKSSDKVFHQQRVDQTHLKVRNLLGLFPCLDSSLKPPRVCLVFASFLSVQKVKRSITFSSRM